MQGEQYVSRKTGKIVPGKEFVIPISCCPQKCFLKIDASNQKQLHDTFWKEGDYRAQNVMLCSMVKTKSCDSENKKDLKIETWEYSFPPQYDRNPGIITCQKFLCKVLNLTRSRFITIQQKLKKNETMQDKRGGKHELFS